MEKDDDEVYMVAIPVSGLTLTGEDGESFELSGAELINLCGAAMSGVELTQLARRMGQAIKKLPNVPDNLVAVIERLSNDVADEKLQMALDTIEKIMTNVVGEPPEGLILPEGEVFRA